MRGPKLLVLLSGSGMLILTSVILFQLSHHQHLSQPGVLTQAGDDPHRLVIQLPEKVLDYTSEWREPSEIELSVLPRDTSFAHRHYVRKQDWLDLRVVLMGADRTSIHKPQLCLTGQGWRILNSQLADFSYQGQSVPLYRLDLALNLLDENRTPVEYRGIYLYWFVSDKDMTPHHHVRMINMAKRLLTEGVLPRWAYVSCFTLTRPGDEDDTLALMTQFLENAAPQFLSTGEGETQSAAQNGKASLQLLPIDEL